jgi:hypothetical protein
MGTSWRGAQVCWFERIDLHAIARDVPLSAGAVGSRGDVAALARDVVAGDPAERAR